MNSANNDQNNGDVYNKTYAVTNSNSSLNQQNPPQQAAHQEPVYQQAAFQQGAPQQGVAQQSAPQQSVPQQGMPQQNVYQQAMVQKKSHGWIIAIVVIVCVFILIIGSMVSCSNVVGSMFGTAGFANVDDPVSDVYEPTIGIIEMNGEIQYDGSVNSPEGLKILLDRAEKNSNIEGVILKVNSGGGVATAGEEMSALVKDFSKPIIVASQATNASAAYEISSQADYIFTDRTTAIGAIGVVMSVTDLSGLYDKLGIEVENIKSAESKDAGFGNRPLTEEERAWYQSMVDRINEVFIETVAEGRGMDIEDVEELANGLPYLGLEAVENGLADEIGNTDDAISYLSDLLGYDRLLPTVNLAGTSNDLMSLLDLLSETDQKLDASQLKDILNEVDGGSVAK